MAKLKINRSHLTTVFWSTLLAESAFTIHSVISELQDQHRLIEDGRKQADVNTGSVSFASSLCIAFAAAYFRPQVVAEVGTFVGRSAFSLLTGAGSVGAALPLVHSCDFSNDIPLNFPNQERVVRYPRQSSTQMFASLLDKSIHPDFYFFDGRLSKEDVELLQELRADKALILLDDFVGVEKGVSNAMLLQQAFPESFLLAYPCAEGSLAPWGVSDLPVVAAMIPTQKAVFTNS